MAFPSIASSVVTTITASATTDATATLPSSIAAGDLLIAWIASSTAATQSTPTGWTLLGEAANANPRRVWLLARVATADSNDALVQSRAGGACLLGIVISRITGWFGTIATGIDYGAISVYPGSAPQTSVTYDPGAGTGVDFSTKTPAWGSADTLWFGGVAQSNNNATDPSGYTLAYWNDNGGWLNGQEAWYRQNAASSEDPPNFGDGASFHSAFFIAIRPAGASGSIGTAAGAATVSAAGKSTAVTTLTAAAGVATVSGVGGTLTALVSSVFKNNTGTALASLTNVTAWVYSLTTGALVVKLTAQATNGSGVLTLQDAAIVTATTYRVVFRNEDDGAEGMETLTAS